MARSGGRRPAPSEDRILAAAEALFAERGYGPPSLRELIARCGCSTTAFYARFPDKEAVLVALVDRLLAELALRAADALPAARSLEDGFAVGLDALLAAIGARRGLVAVALSAEGAAVRDRIHVAYQGLAALMADQLRAAPLSDEVDPEALAWALIGALDLAVRRWAVFGSVSDAELPEVLRATARAMLPRR